MPPQGNGDREFVLGDWLVQPSLNRLAGPSGEVQLEPRAMELLVFLAGHAGRVVSRREIVDAVWRLEFVSDATLSSGVARLRRALGDDAASPRYIETIAKRGYRLLAEPVDVLEVAARPGGAFRVGGWLVEPSLNRMTRDDATVQLDRSAMDVLLCLAERAGEPVPRRELVDRVWRTEAVSELTVSTRIAELRAALGAGAPDNPGVIEALPGGGYRLAAPIGFAEPRATVTPFPSATAAEPEREPYPGLAAFTAADAEHFIGREAETAEMWRRISGRRLLAVAGPSGVGKSSFVAAGVIPAAPPGWACLLCTPSEAPFLSLARALVREVAGEPEQVERLLAFDDPEAAIAVVAGWRERFDDALLVVDQLEELFTLSPPEVRGRFAELLARLAGDAGVHVVLVLRDDFLHLCQAHPGLEPIFRDLTMLGPPTAANLRRALVEPARRRGFGFSDDELADEMVAAVAGERGALPLLAFAARRLWELRDRERRLVTRAAYESIGGVAGALAQHAEATLEAIGAERLPLVREIFRNLVTAQQTRAARPVDELLSVFDEGRRGEAGRVLQALIDARLLTAFEEETAGEGEGPRRVEIVHEALLREWPRLVRWQTQDTDAARLRDQLRQAAQLWQARGRPTELLWSGTPFREYLVWRERYPGGLSDSERDFADAMIAHAGRRRRRRRLVAAAVVLAAVAVAAVTTGLWWRSELNARRLEARTLLETARRLVDWSPPNAFAHALASLEVMDSPEARRLALEALWRSPMPMVIDSECPKLECAMTGGDFSPDGSWLAAGHFGGRLSLWPASGGPAVDWPAHGTAARAYFLPDSRAVMSISATDPLLRFWSVPDHRSLGDQEQLATPGRSEIGAKQVNTERNLTRWLRDPSWPGGWRPDRSAVVAWNRLAPAASSPAALAPDGQRLVVGHGAELLSTSVAGPDGPTLIGRSRSSVEFLAFAPGGDRLATAHGDGSFRLWSLAAGTAVALESSPGRPGGPCNDLRFDPTATLLAAGPDDGAVAVHRIDGPPGAEPLPLLLLPRYRLAELAFHPDGGWLATVQLARISLWPVDRRRQPFVLRGHTANVERVAFSADSGSLVSFASDGTVRWWPASPAAGEAPRLIHDWGHPVDSVIGWVAPSPDGRFVVTTGGEDAVRLVPVDGLAPRVLGGFEQRVLRAAVSPDGRSVAAAGRVAGRRVLRVWHLESGAVSDVDLGDPGPGTLEWAMFPEFLPDGSLLVAISGPLLRVDPSSGRVERVADGVGRFAVARRAPVALTLRTVDFSPSEAWLRDLAAGTSVELTSHGRQVASVALDETGALAVTGGADGIIRVGPASGEPPHWLVGPPQVVSTVAVSPDRRWIASGSPDGTIRLWPMPDLARTPLHALPHSELLTRLKTLTNLRAVPDPDETGGYVVRAGAFPGWRTVPDW